MTQRVKGTVPEKLTFFRFEMQNYKQSWADQYRYSEETLAELNELQARPCTVVNSANKARIEQLQNQNSGRRYEMVEVDNDPITDVRLLEQPGWRDKNYSAVLPSLDIVSVPPDAVMDAMINSVVDHGVIKAKFQFLTRGNTTVLARVDSALHKETVLTDVRRALNIHATKLQVGGVYETPVDGQYVYLGKLDNDFVVDRTTYQYSGNYYNRGAGTYVYTYKFTKDSWQAQRGWVSLETYNELMRGEFKGYYKPTHPVITPKRHKVSYKVGEVDVSVFYEKLRELIRKECEAVEAANHVTDEERAYQKLRNQISFAQQYLIRPAGQPIDPELLKAPEVAAIYEKVQM